MEPLKKNIQVFAVLSAQVPDTTGEVLDIKNADISSLKKGTAPMNTEHVNPEDIDKAAKNDDEKDFDGFTTIVGRVVNAKKIFSEQDCENEYEYKAWQDLEVPMIVGVVEFFDGKDATDNQKAAASLVRMAPDMIGFSVEGQILHRDGNRLSDTVIKKIACTLKPANKASRIEGVIKDSASDSPASVIRKASEDETNFYQLSNFKHNYLIGDDYGLSGAVFKLKKALDAGGTNVAPSALTGGAALQKESQIGQLLKLSGKKPLKMSFLKSILPGAQDDQLEKIMSYLKQIRMKKYEEQSKEAFEQLKK
jgi:hypothetical protein